MNLTSQIGFQGGGIGPGRVRRSNSLHRRQPLGTDLLTNLVQWWPLGLDRERGLHSDLLLSSGAFTAAPTDGPGVLATNFAGTGQYLATAADTRLNGGNFDFSFCGWVRAATISQFPYIGGVWTGSAGQRSYSLQAAGNLGGFFYYEQGTTTGWINNTTVLTDNTWAFLCGWHDSVNDIWGLRINATDASKALSGGTNPATGTGLAIARQGAAIDSTANKDICRVGYWTKALSTAERDYLYNGGIGRDYPFV